MRGLIKIPSEKELLAAYRQLQAPARAAKPPSVSSLALWSQWSRLDPRLAEILTAFLGANWSRIPPIEFHQALRSQPWPAAGCVLLEQIRSLEPPEDPLFERWYDCVTSGIEPAHHELFFIGLRKFGGRLMRSDAEIPLTPYLRWGYLGREVLRTKSARFQGAVTWVAPETRKRVLDDLIARRRGGRITVQDYETALGGWVSRRQAQRDLSAHPRLKPRGRTRGKWYSIA